MTPPGTVDCEYAEMPERRWNSQEAWDGNLVAALREVVEYVADTPLPVGLAMQTSVTRDIILKARALLESAG